MSRLRAPDFKDRKAQIMDIAANLFAAYGYHGASVTDIAKASGTAKSRLYYYFSSKEQLLYELLEDHAKLINFRLSAALQEGQCAREQLLVYTKELLAINMRARGQHTIILRDLDKLTPAHRAEITAQLRAPIEGLYGLLCEINPELERQDDKKFAAAMLLLGMINWSHVWFDMAGPVSPEQYAKIICDTFIGGFANAVLPP